jgi:hypothetical protein
MYFVVTLNWGKGFREEGDQVPFPVFRGGLGEDGSGRKVGAVCFDVKGLGRVREDENGGRHDILFEPIEC